MNNHDGAITSIDKMLTEVWLNLLLVQNGYYNKLIVDMTTATEHVRWHEFTEKINWTSI